MLIFKYIYTIILFSSNSKTIFIQTIKHPLDIFSFKKNKKLEQFVNFNKKILALHF